MVILILGFWFIYFLVMFEMVHLKFFRLSPFSRGLFFFFFTVSDQLGNCFVGF